MYQRALSCACRVREELKAELGSGEVYSFVWKWSNGIEAPNPGIQDTERIVGLKLLL